MLVEMQTAKLEGAALDWLVAKVTGLIGPEDGVYVMPLNFEEGLWAPVMIESEQLYSPSTNWAQGGPLIEKYMIRTQYAADTEKLADAGCFAQTWRPYAIAHGDTLTVSPLAVPLSPPSWATRLACRPCWYGRSTSEPNYQR